MITMAILGVMVGVLLSSMNPLGQFKKARDTQRKSDLDQLRAGLEAYAAVSDGTYPAASGWQPVATSPCQALVTKGLLSKCPADPSGGTGYEYRYRTTSDYSFALSAKLEGGGWWAVCGDGRSGAIDAQPNGSNCPL